MKFAVMILRRCAAARGRRGGARGGKTISKTTISFATATPGGGFPLYGNALAEVMNAADPTLSIEPRNTKGSNENIPLLEAGSVDIATVAGEPSYEAFMGIGRPKATKLKILTAMYSSPGMFVVRADSPYRTIQDLVGQAGRVRRQGLGPADPVALYPRRHRAEAGRGFQVDLSRPRRRRPGDGGGRPRRGAVGRRHRLAAVSPSWPRARAARGSSRRPLRRSRRIRAKHTFLKPLTIPAGSYPKQSGGDRFGRLLELHPGAREPARRCRLPAGARRLHGAEAAFCNKLAQACETTAANTVAAAPDLNLIHPGVLKYFREIGVAR